MEAIKDFLPTFPKMEKPARSLSVSSEKRNLGNLICSSCYDFRSLVQQFMFSNLTSNNVDFILIDALKLKDSEQWKWSSGDFMDTRYVQCMFVRIHLLNKPCPVCSRMVASQMADVLS